jgi:hypothetical protein
LKEAHYLRKKRLNYLIGRMENGRNVGSAIGSATGDGRLPGGLKVKLPVFVLGILCLAACAKGNLVYVETREDSLVTADEVVVNYFFDRTESIRPFTYKTDTAYSLAMSSLVTVGQDLFGSDPLSFYDFAGELRRISVLPEQIQVDIQKQSFYVPDRARFASTESIEVINIDGQPQPFFTVAEYIRKNHREQNELNIITTDLYEQSDISQYFHRFYRNAFARGVSGAIFAIKSEFRGPVYNIGAGNQRLDVDGFSTVFVLITGKNNILREFCDQYSKKLDENRISFNLSLFALNEQPSAADMSIGNVMAGSERGYERRAAEKLNTMINLRRISGAVKTWAASGQSDDAGQSASPVTRSADVEVYRVMSNAEARYVRRIGGSNEENAPQMGQLSLEYFDGGKAVSGKPSAFAPELADTVLSADFFQDDGIWYMALKTTNKNLKSGYYRVKYNIVPGWVIDLDAGDGAVGFENMRESNRRGERIHVLHLRSIYEAVLEDFNRENGFSGSFYLVRGK